MSYFIYFVSFEFITYAEILTLYCDKARNVLKMVFLEKYRSFIQRRSTRAVIADERPWRSQVISVSFLAFILFSSRNTNVSVLSSDQQHKGINCYWIVCQLFSRGCWLSCQISGSSQRGKYLVLNRTHIFQLITVECLGPWTQGHPCSWPSFVVISQRFPVRADSSSRGYLFLFSTTTLLGPTLY